MDFRGITTGKGQNTQKIGKILWLKGQGLQHVGHGKQISVSGKRIFLFLACA
jgi:hypothetical protein